MRTTWKVGFVAACVMAHFIANASIASAQESQAAKTTRAKLKQKISVEFKETRTQDIFAEIKGEMEKSCNFKIDNASGVSNNTKLTYSAKNKTVEEVLNEMSDRFDFGWIVESNAANNKVDGWVIIRKSSKGKERGYPAGKDPKTSSLDHNFGPEAPRIPTIEARREVPQLTRRD